MVFKHKEQRSMARPKHRTNYSLAQKANFVNKFLQSGLSKTVFCRQHSIFDSAFYRWQNEQKTKATDSNTPLFV